MKKIYSLLAAVLLGSGMTFAQDVVGEEESISVFKLAGALQADSALTAQFATLTSDGGAIFAGTFDTAVEGLTPAVEAACTYVMKFGADMKPIWKYVIPGAATPTAIVADTEGGAYVAGVFADEIEMGGKTLAGVQEWGEYVTARKAAFIAHFSSKGKLLAVNGITPSEDESFAAAVEIVDDSYVDRGLSCQITDLALEGGKLYGAFSFCDAISTTDGSKTINGGSLQSEVMWLFETLNAGAVGEFDADLNLVDFPFVLKSNTVDDGLQVEERVQSIALSAANGHLYIGATGNGTLNYAAGNTGSFNFEKTANAETVNGYMLFDLNLADKTVKTADWKSITEDNYSASSINKVAVIGDNVILAGCFQGKLAFDNAVEAKGHNDLFVASVKAADLSLNYTKASGIDEGDKTKMEETFLCANVNAEDVDVYGCTRQLSDAHVVSGFVKSYNTADGKPYLIENEMEDAYILAMVETLEGINVAVSTVSPFTDLTLVGQGLTATAIRNVAAAKTGKQSIFTLAGQRVNAPTRGLYIMNGKKLLVK